MQPILRNFQLGAAVLAATLMLPAASPNFAAVAQTAPAATSVTLSEPTIKALQEALTKQGIAVKADGVLTDETRVAIRKYQSQHHLPVTGEPDKATLDKLGVADRQSAAPAQGPAVAQATPTTPPAGGPPAQAPTQAAPQGPMQPGQMQGGMMMNQPMHPGQMHGGMMMNRPMQPSHMQGDMMMNCPMMQGTTQGHMMQMMHSMMQMMQTQMQMVQMMQTQMQMMQRQMQPGQMQPGQSQPGAR